MSLLKSDIWDRAVSVNLPVVLNADNQTFTTTTPTITASVQNMGSNTIEVVVAGQTYQGTVVDGVASFDVTVPLSVQVHSADINVKAGSEIVETATIDVEIVNSIPQAIGDWTQDRDPSGTASIADDGDTAFNMAFLPSPGDRYILPLNQAQPPYDMAVSVSGVKVRLLVKGTTTDGSNFFLKYSDQDLASDGFGVDFIASDSWSTRQDLKLNIVNDLETDDGGAVATITELQIISDGVSKVYSDSISFGNYEGQYSNYIYNQDDAGGAGGTTHNQVDTQLDVPAGIKSQYGAQSMPVDPTDGATSQGSVNSVTALDGLSMAAGNVYKLDPGNYGLIDINGKVGTAKTTTGFIWIDLTGVTCSQLNLYDCEYVCCFGFTVTNGIRYASNNCRFIYGTLNQKPRISGDEARDHGNQPVGNHLDLHHLTFVAEDFTSSDSWASCFLVGVGTDFMQQHIDIHQCTFQDNSQYGRSCLYTKLGRDLNHNVVDTRAFVTVSRCHFDGWRNRDAIHSKSDGWLIYDNIFEDSTAVVPRKAGWFYVFGNVFINPGATAKPFNVYGANRNQQNADPQGSRNRYMWNFVGAGYQQFFTCTHTDGPSLDGGQQDNIALDWYNGSHYCIVSKNICVDVSQWVNIYRIGNQASKSPTVSRPVAERVPYQGLESSYIHDMEMQQNLYCGDTAPVYHDENADEENDYPSQRDEADWNVRNPQAKFSDSHHLPSNGVNSYRTPTGQITDFLQPITIAGVWSAENDRIGSADITIDPSTFDAFMSMFSLSNT